MKQKSSIPINQEEINVYLKDVRKLKVMTPERERVLADKMLSGKISLKEKEEINTDLWTEWLLLMVEKCLLVVEQKEDIN